MLVKILAVLAQNSLFIQIVWTVTDSVARIQDVHARRIQQIEIVLRIVRSLQALILGVPALSIHCIKTARLGAIPSLDRIPGVHVRTIPLIRTVHQTVPDLRGKIQDAPAPSSRSIQTVLQTVISLPAGTLGVLVPGILAIRTASTATDSEERTQSVHAKKIPHTGIVHQIVTSWLGRIQDVHVTSILSILTVLRIARFSLDRIQDVHANRIPST